MAAQLLSIIMPSLNAEATIERSLDSVRSQSVDGVEVVVVDGGSSDGTVRLLESRDDVRWHSEPDRGLSDAFNKGAARASGEVLGWLNADDVYLPGALALVQEEFSRDDSLVWLTGRCLIVDGNGREIRKGVTRYKNALLDRYTYPRHLTHNFVSAPSTFFRRDAFEAAGRMDTSLRYSMDYDLYLRLGRQHPPRLLRTPLAAFTMADGTLSMTGFETQFVEHQQVASRYRSDAPLPVALNRVLSRGIVFAYKGLRQIERRRKGG